MGEGAAERGESGVDHQRPGRGLCADRFGADGGAAKPAEAVKPSEAAKPAAPAAARRRHQQPARPPWPRSSRRAR